MFRAPPGRWNTVCTISTRRIAGSVVTTHGKNSLWRSGRGVASAAWEEWDAVPRQPCEPRARQRNRARWDQLRQETTAVRREQRTRFRFRHRQDAFLGALE